MTIPTKIHRWLWLLALTAFPGLSQSRDVKPAPGPHLVWASCSGRAEAGAPAIPVHELDASLGVDGSVHLLYDRKLWSSRRRGSTLKAETLLPSASSSTPFRATPIKYRNGYFWRREEHEVQSWGQAKGWSRALKAKGDFQDFDITYQGSIALIGTDGHLLEIYEPEGERPSYKISYPDLGVSSQQAATLHFYWTKVRSASVDQSLLIYFAGCGRLFLWNVPQRSFKEVDTPWPAFNAKDISETIKDGAANLSNHPGPGCIQFVPTSENSARIAYQLPKADVTFQYGPDGKVTRVDPKPTVNTSNFLHSFDLDLTSATKGEVTKNPEMKLPIWIGPDGGIVPLSSIQSASERGSAPKQNRQDCLSRPKEIARKGVGVSHASAR